MRSVCCMCRVQPTVQRHVPFVYIMIRLSAYVRLYDSYYYMSKRITHVGWISRDRDRFITHWHHWSYAGITISPVGIRVLSHQCCRHWRVSVMASPASGPRQAGQLTAQHRGAGTAGIFVPWWHDNLVLVSSWSWIGGAAPTFQTYVRPPSSQTKKSRSNRYTHQKRRSDLCFGRLIRTICCPAARHMSGSSGLDLRCNRILADTTS